MIHDDESQSVVFADGESRPWIMPDLAIKSVDGFIGKLRMDFP